MQLREKCPYYWYGLEGNHVCNAPATRNTSINGARLPDCGYTEHTDDQCYAQSGTLTTIIHLIPLTETIFSAAEVRMFKHEVDTNQQT
ncbi:MAG: hypothetical protein NUV98_05640 [Candidatus Roizmanbacteria bacterium]|nr:hypothetical protein [Candidatus Roizmanbacteria bacterium]